MHQEYTIKLIYGFNKFNKGDALEIICYLASMQVGFEPCPDLDSETRLIIGDKTFSYEDFRREKSEIEKLVLRERELQKGIID